MRRHLIVLSLKSDLVSQSFTQNFFFMALSNFELALTLSNFVGSGLSAVGSGFIILCYVLLPLKKHYRHLLILNLAISGKHQSSPKCEHRCSWNSPRFYQCYGQCSIGSSRAHYWSIISNPSMYRKWFYRTAICPGNSKRSVCLFWANGSHLQATDTSIFAISIVTIMIVTASHGSSWSVKSKKSKEQFIAVVCGCTWALPILTSR